MAYSTAISIVRCATPVSSADSAMAIRSSPPARRPRAPRRRRLRRRERPRRVDRVHLLDVHGERSTTPSPWSQSNRTITAASSASGTSGADRSLDFADRAQRLAGRDPGSHLLLLLVTARVLDQSPAAAFEKNGDGASA